MRDTVGIWLQQCPSKKRPERLFSLSDSHHDVRTQKEQPLSENTQVRTLTLDCSASRNMRKSISIVG